MVDNLTPEARSERMSKIGGRHTAPEMIVRRMVHALGFRFRLHQKGLPGSPDLVFARHKKVLFVHGCYWHGHGCKIGKLPKSNVEFWRDKILKNRARDARNLRELRELGWSVHEVWQCETKKPAELKHALLAFLGKPRKIRST